ncbi:glycosyltransferase family 2 protein [Heyndrickxia oleronia]|uniref:tetratricopeptide repeat-containing glycosyltransferase family 2 protein n=1 Tax=Heyndrickxia oleronia TaxID=38875 RepID=UPI00204176F5|nr:glycosyltransferase family 2 protein [Heyndrickxia oleronia]MCM3238364.1 glycosyltransferase family 2 protein [Heyndrickxia oleronia]
MKPFISLCMIVKNEEKVLDRCLTSVVNSVDEIIIVDTGSIDQTKEIASRYTTKIYDFEWINDFSAARNFAASKATGEWILVLDADEYVDEENFTDFLQKLKDDNGEFDTYYAKIINFTGNFGENLVQNFHDRIYKNNGDISYYRQIHEQFKNNKNKPLKNKHSNLVIFHSGYLNQTVHEKEKNRRNKEILDQEMKKGVTNAFDYFNYGNEYCSIGEYSKALDAYLEAYKRKTDFRLSWVSTTLIQIIICLINLKRYNDALNVIEDAENIYENSPEFPYFKGEIYFLRGQLEDAKTVFLQITNNSGKYNHIIFRPDLKEQRPHQRLGEIFLLQEDYNGAIYHYSSVLNINNNDKVSIKKVIYILNKFHSVNEISDFLNSKGLVSLKNVSDYVRACFNVGNPALALCLLDNFYEENKLLYKVALLKKLVINNEGSIKEINGIFDKKIIQHLFDSNWVNVVDLLLLKKEYGDKDNDLSILLKDYEHNREFKALESLIDGKNCNEMLNEGLLLFTLQTLICYKKYTLCTEVLSYMRNLKGKIIVQVAALLFSNGFKAEALQLYDKSDWNYFSEQDFINIIKSLLETDNPTGAIEMAKYAVMIFEEDFRFYGYILEHTNEAALFTLTFNKAKELFNDSLHLDKLAM